MTVQASPTRAAISARRPDSSAPFSAGAYEVASASRPSDLAAIRAELKGDIRALKAKVANGDGSSALAGEIAALRDLIQELGARSNGAVKPAPLLRAIGLEGPAATALARTLKGKSSDVAALRDALPQILTVTDWPVQSARALVAVVGASGVGKTTTAAKLAARARMQGRSVTFVGCDSFRVGATEQLARYAHLMGVEVVWARNPDQLRSIMDQAKSDFLVVDTSGRAPTPDGVESALAAPRHATSIRDRARHVLLCVPASIRAVDAARVARLYGVLSPTSLVSTKLDETEAPAGLVHAAWAARLPYSVLCFGQRVPEDVGPATAATLLEYLTPRGRGKAVAA